jgi:hypothetical protein
MIKTGERHVCRHGAEVNVLKLSADGDVLLGISSGGNPASAYFRLEDIKELRKWLKKLQRQLEQGDVDG